MARPEDESQPKRRRWAVFVEGVVTIRPATEATYGEFVEDFLAVEYPLMQRSALELVGAWRRTDGVANQLVHIYRFASLSAIEETGRTMSQDAGYSDLGTIYRTVDEHAFRYRRQVGVSLSFAGNDRLDEMLAEAPEMARYYLEVRGHVGFRRQAEAFELLQRQLDAWEAAGLFRRALAYDMLFGEHGDFAAFGVLPGGPSSLSELRAAVDPELARSLAALTSDEQLFVLEALPYSPLR